MGPVGSLAIGAAFPLTSVTATAAATIALTFSGSANAGAYTPMTATVELQFGGSPFITVEQEIGASIPLLFNGDPDLRVAGRPFQVFALPQSYTVRANRGSYTVKARYQNFTVRAVR